MLSAFLTLATLVCPLIPQQADRDQLLQGLETLERLGQPGTVAIYGADAFPVLLSNSEPPQCYVGAARFGRGRVMAIAHSAYLAGSAAIDAERSPARLLQNALRWLADEKEACSVGILGEDDQLAQSLREWGHDVVSSRSLNRILNQDVVIWRDRDAANGEGEQQLRRYVRRGGALLIGECPWGYEQAHARLGYSLRRDLPENRVLAPMGLVLADGYARAGRDTAYTIRVPKEEYEGHAGLALAAMSQAPEARFLAFVEAGIRGVRFGDEQYLPRVAQLLRAHGEQAQAPPTRKQPVERDQPLRRLFVSYQSRLWEETEPEKLEAAPGAEEFPGAVPKSAVRVRGRAITIEAGREGWVSTGLYLAAGDRLRIKVLAGQPAQWRVRIGCHSDALWRKSSWKRWPVVSRTMSLQADLQASSPFGGLIYLEAVRGQADALQIEVSGAVEAPFFDLTRAEHDRQYWRRSRCAPAPWAELAGEHLVISLPAESVRQLDDPRSVLEWWDAVIRSHCELDGSQLPQRRERFVADIQISAGYMHSGYPIMTHLDVAESPGRDRLATVIDLQKLASEGHWGYFHELGHNWQDGAWTFQGTGEVTCNLFTLFTMQKRVGIEPWKHSWLEGQKAAGARYLELGADFEAWKSQPGVALLMYVQLQREFGWQPFQTVFREYLELSGSQRPRSNQDKIDQWMTRLSHAVSRDLRPFFRKWGLPLSEAAFADSALNGYATWMPEFDDLR